MLGDRLGVAAIERDRCETFTIEAENPAAALRAELDARSLAARTVAIGLSRSTVTVKPIELPAVAGATQDMVKFELERHLPIPADDAAFDFVPLPPDAEADAVPVEGKRVLIAAADRRLIDSALRLADEAKLRPVSITVASHDLLALVDADRRQRVVWLHRVGDTAELLLLNDAMVVFSRSFAAADDATLLAETRRSLAGARWRTCDAIWVSGDGAAAAPFLDLGVPISDPPWTSRAERCLAQVAEPRGALALAKKLEEHETVAGRRREFITSMYEMSDRRLGSLGFTEYLVKLFDTANREHEYSRTLLKLFQFYYAAGKYGQAGETLDRAAELDPYEPGHGKRLEMLRGRIDDHQYNRIANRFHRVSSKPQAGAAAPEPAPSAPVRESEPTVLEDFILQAEIYLQYGMRSKALERLERVSKLFPREEQKNEKLRYLYISAGFTPVYEVAAAVAKATTSSPAPVPPAAEKTQPAPPPAAAPSHYEENAVDNFARVTEITRNIYRQANVKSVLFTAVNDIGRHFNASRCVAGLCTIGKPPSAALEYCAPGVKQSDVMAIVKIIGLTQQLAANGPVTISNAKAARELAPAAEHIHALNIESLLAVPLIDSGEQSGILILEQTSPRQWQQTDIVVLKTIAEQMVLAVSNVRLRTLMKTLAVTDEKSGLLKRSSYLDVLLSEVRRSLQQKSPMTLMLLHFGKASALAKEIGEAQVESMMQQIGQALASHIRQNDVAVRYDLTTIALVLSDTTEKNAFLVVDKMRKVLAPTKVPGTERTPPISVGIAEAVLQERYDAVDMVTEVINRVESALEVARAEGGNKAHSLAPAVHPNAVA